MRTRRAILAIACASSLLAGCDLAPSAEQRCYEAERAFAEATERFLAVENKSAKDAWMQAHLAAKRWRDKVCR